MTISPSQAYELLNKEMVFIVPDTYNRILGQENIHWQIDTVLAYWQSEQARQEWGDFSIKIVVDRTNSIGYPYILPWKAFLVNGISMGNGFAVSLYFWGPVTGINTVVTRYRFWEVFLISGIIQNIKSRFFGIPAETFIPSLEQKP